MWARRPEYLETVVAQLEHLAADEEPIGPDRLVLAVEGGHRVDERPNFVVREAVVREPRDELAAVRLAADVRVAGELGVALVQHRPRARPLAHRVRPAAVVAVPVRQHHRVDGVERHAEGGELIVERRRALRHVGAAVEQRVPLAVADEVGVGAAKRVALDREAEPP